MAHPSQKQSGALVITPPAGWINAKTAPVLQAPTGTPLLFNTTSTLTVMPSSHPLPSPTDRQAHPQQAAPLKDCVKLGSLLASIAQETGGLTEEEVGRIDSLRDHTPPERLEFK